MPGKKWRAVEDRALKEFRALGLSMPKCAEELTKRFGQLYTTKMVDSRMHCIRQSADPFKALYPDCDLYYLSVCVPWVPPETRAWLDSVADQEPLEVPVQEQLDTALDGVVVVVPAPSQTHCAAR